MNRPSMETQTRLDALLCHFEALGRRQVGYPCNQTFDYSALLPFMRYALNNIGDPFHDSNFRSNTHEAEREVNAHFADLMHLSQDQAWGYVTSGGTEVLRKWQIALYGDIAHIITMPHVTRETVDAIVNDCVRQEDIQED